jgi:hypothetical protein
MKYRKTLILYAALWLVIVLVAFVMQAIPLLLVVTMVNMAFGITTPAALVAVPLALFGTVAVICLRAERQRRRTRLAYFHSTEKRHALRARPHDTGLRLADPARRWLS